MMKDVTVKPSSRTLFTFTAKKKVKLTSGVINECNQEDIDV